VRGEARDYDQHTRQESAKSVPVLAYNSGAPKRVYSAWLIILCCVVAIMVCSASLATYQWQRAKEAQRQALQQQMLNRQIQQTNRQLQQANKKMRATPTAT
jgi:uncharacterized protein YlxW (UPF0749 family)